MQTIREKNTFCTHFSVIPLCQRSIIQCFKCQDRTLHFHCILYYILFSLLWPRASPESLSMHSRVIPEPLSRDNLLSPHFTCSFLPSLFPLLPACSLFHAPSLVSLFLFCFTCSFFASKGNKSIISLPLLRMNFYWCLLLLNDSTFLEFWGIFWHWWKWHLWWRDLFWMDYLRVYYQVGYSE